MGVQRQRMFLNAALLVSAARGAAADMCAPYTRVNGTGLMDKDTVLGHFWNVSAPSDCCALCHRNPACKAYTFHTPLHTGGSSDCYITANVVAHPVSNAISGYVPGALPTPPPTPPPTPHPPTPDPHPPLGRLPNFVMILTDDQDIHLGGMEPMPKTRRLLGDAGLTSSSMYIHTPVCCPSRAETLTGRFFHNVKLNRIKQDPARKLGGGCMANGCMCVDEDKVNPVSFAVDLADIGYEVGMFGKHLNNCPKTKPPGFSRWFANGGGDFFNTTFFDDRAASGVTTTNASFYAGYQTSILGNVSINWIEELATRPASQRKPFFCYIGPHAPHVPATPAPWYAHGNFEDPSLASHYRTPNFNSSATDHHWVVAQQAPLTDAEAGSIDQLFRDRWRTLLSVDDLVEGVVGALDALNLTDNTYVLYTSDHGYNLGQFRLAGNKLHAYEQTLRIPLLVRGPGIPPRSTWSLPTSNADLAPTFLGLAGTFNERMDGTSFAPQLLALGGGSSSRSADRERAKAQPWRTFHYSEYNSLGNWEMFNHLIDDPMSHTYRAIRFVDDPTYGDALYAEYTSLDDWNFQNYSSGSYKFYEFFDYAQDPWELRNLYNSSSNATKAELHRLVTGLFGCKGASCQQLPAAQ